MSIIEDSREYWSERAPEYSALHMSSLHSEKRDRFFAQVKIAVEAAAASRGCEPGELRALDLGCGSGFMTLLLCELGVQVTGVDFSAAMLEQAAANVASEGFAGQATFSQMPAQELALEDEAFDLVVSRNVTWVLEDVDKVYAEVLRVLKPGGVFLNLDAAYGQGFRAAEERGEALSHPTQTVEQLQRRNDIARELTISFVDRPGWDVQQFWTLGASEVQIRNMSANGCNAGPTPMFALQVRK